MSPFLGLIQNKQPKSGLNWPHYNPEKQKQFNCHDAMVKREISIFNELMQ
jgi:hypothetical protein